MTEEKIMVIKTLKTFYGFDIESYKKLGGYEDLNFLVESSNLKRKEKKKFVWKIMNLTDSQRKGQIEAIADIMQFLHDAKFSSPSPIAALDGKLVGDAHIDRSLRKCVLLSYMPGFEIHQMEFDEVSFSGFCNKVGVFCGNLDKELKGISHPDRSLHRPELGVKLENVHLLRDKLCILADKEVLKICLNAIEKVEQFCRGEQYLTISKGVIHGDLRLANMIYRKSNIAHYSIEGVIDFFDASISAYIFEIAALIASVMYEASRRELKIYASAKASLAGYTNQFHFNSTELNFLYDAVLGRLCMLRVFCGFDMLESKATSDHVGFDFHILEFLIVSMFETGKQYWSNQVTGL